MARRLVLLVYESRQRISLMWFVRQSYTSNILNSWDGLYIAYLQKIARMLPNA
jgi:hypothetical protein